MLLSKNYFLPTINGRVYFDKPLLSYWVILPFSLLTGGITELTTRLPSAIFGLGTVLITYKIGMHLFSKRSSIISAWILASSFMFIFWSKTASAETMNMFMVWLALWIYLSRKISHKPIYAIIFYITLAISAFCKGLVAPFLVIFSLLFTNLFESILNVKKTGFSYKIFFKCVSLETEWLFSSNSAKGIVAGLIVFFLFLFTPVMVTGLWESVELMWRENFLRFFKPFDHIEPFYVYLKYIPFFIAPWTFVFVASLFNLKRWLYDKNHRWIIFIAMSIFIFFTSSGSRRGYYILPILPALAIITGETLDNWLETQEFPKKDAIYWAMISTCFFPFFAGTGFIYGYTREWLLKSPFFVLLGILIIVAAICIILLFWKKRFYKGFVWLSIIIFSLELWAYTTGIAIQESRRTLVPFVNKVSAIIENVRDEDIALYKISSSAFIFYLKRHRIKTIDSLDGLKAFVSEKNQRYVITGIDDSAILFEKEDLKKPEILLVEKEKRKNRDNPIVLLSFP